MSTGDQRAHAAADKTDTCEGYFRIGASRTREIF